MRVILLKDVPGQGKRGDILNVAEGYARNYLLPRGLASEASKGKIKELAERRQASAMREEKMRQEAAELAARLESLTVIVRTKAGKAAGSSVQLITRILPMPWRTSTRSPWIKRRS